MRSKEEIKNIENNKGVIKMINNKLITIEEYDKECKENSDKKQIECIKEILIKVINIEDLSYDEFKEKSLKYINEVIEKLQLELEELSKLDKCMYINIGLLERDIKDKLEYLNNQIIRIESKFLN